MQLERRVNFRAMMQAGMERWKWENHKIGDYRPGMQRNAFESEAEVIGLGGEAGGGKTFLAFMFAWDRHPSSILFRYELTQMENHIIGTGNDVFREFSQYKGGVKRRWDHPKGSLQLGALKYPGSFNRYRGGEWSGMMFDEATEMLKSEVTSVMGWNRSTNTRQKCQTLMFFNPPSTTEGEWVLEYYAPWIDKDYPKPAQEGEIRYFANIDGQSVEVPNGEPRMHKGKLRYPRPRTFFRSRLDENPDLRDTYPSILEDMPWPYNQQLLEGDFEVGRGQDAWQVIDPAWVDEAMKRWTNMAPCPLTALGCDVARGGPAQTVVAKRHGVWCDELVAVKGEATASGDEVVKLIMDHRRGNSQVNIDVASVGTSPYDTLKRNRVNVVGINASEGSDALDRSNQLTFFNKRAELWWKFREALEPGKGKNIALPPDMELKADLCVPRFEVTPGGIKIEGKKDIAKRLGRSTDRADAVILAFHEPSGLYPKHIGMGAVSAR